MKAACKKQVERSGALDNVGLCQLLGPLLPTSYQIKTAGGAEVTLLNKYFIIFTTIYNAALLR